MTAKAKEMCFRRMLLRAPWRATTESAISKDAKEIQTTHEAKLFNREYKRLRKEGLSNKDAMNQAASWIPAPPKLRKSAI